RRVLVLDADGRQELGVPFRWKRQGEEWERRGDWKKRPFHPPFSPLPFVFFQNWIELRASDRNEGPNGSAGPECRLYEIVATQLAQPVGVPVERKGSLDALRKHAHHFFSLKEVVGVLAAGDHASELSNEIKEKRELQQTWMDQKPGIPSNSLNHQM